MMKHYNKIPKIENVNCIRCISENDLILIQEKICNYVKGNSNFIKVNLSDKMLALLLDKHSCYGIKYGKCSLYLPKGVRWEDKEIYYENDECQLICESLVKGDNYKSIFKDLKLILSSCGHWTVNGQHRICVLKRLGMTIPIGIKEYSDDKAQTECRYCINNNDADYELI